MTYIRKRKAAQPLGFLWGANGHTLYLGDWPNDFYDPERQEEPCTFCASRGLKHGW